MDIDGIARDLAHARELPNASDRAIVYGRVLHQLPELTAQVHNERAAAVAEMRAEGLSWAQVGEKLGVSRNRAAKMLGNETEARAARRRRPDSAGVAPD